MRSFLIGAHATKAPPSLPAVRGAASPKHDKDATQLLAAVEAAGDAAATAKMQRLLRNKVKKCAKCGKPNAFTLGDCNNCGASLSDIEVSFSTNVFMCFAMGIAKGPFPLTISIRRQTESTLVLDDLLALSPLHFNVIPTNAHIPDWRYLLRRPAEGLALIRSLQAELVAAAKEQHLADPAWAAAVHGEKAVEFSVEAEILSGFNYPPSQYQLHIQFMSPALLPHQYYQYLRGVHYTKGRFFPFGYVEKVLARLAGADAPAVPETLKLEDTPIDDVVAFAAQKLDVDYDAVHASFYERVGCLYAKYAGWKAENFRGVATEDDKGSLQVRFNDEADVVTDAAAVTALINADKMALQNYGRPYDAESGKPTGTYYSFPLEADAIELW